MVADPSTDRDQPASTANSRRPLLARFAIPIGFVAVALVSLLLTSRRGLQGDEHHYHKISVVMAESLVSAAQGLPVDWSLVLDGVISRGWSLPGMGVVLAPAHLVFGGEAPLLAVRIHALLVNLALIALIVRELRKLGLSRTLAGTSMLACCVLPYYVAFLSKLWADCIGVHLALLFMLYCERLLVTRRLSGGRAVGAGLLLFAASFVRPQYILLAAIVALRLVFDTIENRSLEAGRGRRSAAVVGTVLLVLLPMTIGLSTWSSALDKRYGDVFLLTSTSLKPLFSSDDFAVSAMKSQKTNNKYHAVYQEVAERAALSRITFTEQADRLVAELPAKNFETLWTRKLRSLGAFYFWENSRLIKILGVRIKDLPEASLLARGLLFANSAAWMCILMVGLLAFVCPARPSNGNYLLPLWLKGAAFLIMMQPLYATTHGRYYVILVPILMLLIFLTVRERVARGEESRHPATRCGVWIAAGQAFAAVYGVALIACLLYVLTVLLPSPIGLPR